MAIKAAIATGSATNFLTAGTWGVIDSGTFIAGENGAIVLPTSYGSTARSATQTPGTIEISGVGVKLNVRTGTTGTMTVHLANVSDHSEIAGTAVVIDVADLPVAAAADLNGGWIFFKFASPVTLPSTAVEVEAKTSSATQVSLWRHDATAGNLSHYFQTTTTGAPTTGDDLIITGAYVDQSTNTAAIVTMNNTDTTDYGSAPTAANSLLSPGIYIGQNATLSFGVSASTNYNLKMSNSIIVASGGTLNMGSVGAEMPRNSSGQLQFDCGTTIDYGLIIRNLGTFVSQGLSRTSGKNIVSCKLNTDEAIGSTSLGVDTDTGWLDNDQIAVASTTRTSTQCEGGTMNGDASATVLTVDGFAGAGGGLAYDHSGTTPTQAEVILLTRNVKVIGTDATHHAYISVAATATVDCDWTEFYWLGSSTTGKKGIEIATTTGTCNFQYCSRHTSTVASSMGWTTTNTTGTGITISNCVSFNVAGVHINVVGNTSGYTTLDSDICIKNSDSTTNLITLSNTNGKFSNITAVGSTYVGIIFNESAGASAAGIASSISNLTSHSNGSYGIQLSCSSLRGTMTNLISWRNTGSGIQISSGILGLIIDGLTLFGNTTTNIEFSGSAGELTFINVVSNGDNVFATTNGINNSNAGCIGKLTIINSDFGTVSGIKTAHTYDIQNSWNSFLMINLINTKLSSGTDVSGQGGMNKSSFISSQRHNTTKGLHKTWKKYGTIIIDTSVYNTALPSMKMIPVSGATTAYSFESGSFKVNVADGQTCTPSVYVRQSESAEGDAADYTGSKPQLILKQNDALGITADVVIDTATNAIGSPWEQLTGTTAAVTDDGVLEFVIACDYGTANSFINVDDFTATVA
jgi:hypothetical protein